MTTQNLHHDIYNIGHILYLCDRYAEAKSELDKVETSPVGTAGSEHAECSHDVHTYRNLIEETVEGYARFRSGNHVPQISLT